MLKYKKGNKMFWTNLSDKFFIGKQKCCQTKPFSAEFMSNKFCCYLKTKTVDSKLKFIEEAIELQKNQNWIKANKLILNSSPAFNAQIAGKS